MILFENIYEIYGDILSASNSFKIKAYEQGMFLKNQHFKIFVILKPSNKSEILYHSRTLRSTITIRPQFFAVSFHIALCLRSFPSLYHFTSHHSPCTRHDNTHANTHLCTSRNNIPMFVFHQVVRISGDWLNLAPTCDEDHKKSKDIFIKINTDFYIKFFMNK